MRPQRSRDAAMAAIPIGFCKHGKIAAHSFEGPTPDVCVCNIVFASQSVLTMSFR